LRVAYRLDKKFSALRRPNPFSALGDASHELTERVERGEFDSLSQEQLRGALEKAWEELIASKYVLVRDAWPIAPIPTPDRWPGYQRTRVRLLKSLAHARRGRVSSAETAAARVLVEKWLEPPGIPLRGRADRVEIAADGVHIVDLKSSWEYGSELHQDHRRQLLLYAAMWQRLNGEWPHSASVETADGRRLSMRVDVAEAEALVDQAVAAFNDYNAAVRSGIAADTLASPSPESCRHCSYRAVCGPFFETISASWGWWLKSVLGTVNGINGSDSGRCALTIAATASNLDETHADVRVIGVPSALAPPPGSTVSVVDACPRPERRELGVSWSTQLMAL
jgi:RecB family exonuclease